jgi:YjbE family integral membrane protein
VILRLVFTGIVGELMLRPYLKLVGGVALIYVAAKLLVRDDAAKNDVKAGAQLWRAVRIVVLADLIMSLDNVIAVAAVAQGNLTLLAIGLLASIPIIIAGAALIMAVLDRVPILVWAGAALLGWIAGDVIATDPAVSGYVSTVFGQILAQQVEIAASAAVALLVIGIGGLWRHLSATRAHGAE